MRATILPTSPYGIGGKFGALAGTDMIRQALTLEQHGQDGQHTVAPEPASDMWIGQAFPAALVDHREPAEGLPGMGADQPRSVIEPYSAIQPKLAAPLFMKCAQV